MTTMYIANATAQQNLFCYQVPENPKVIQQEIPAGGQIRIAANNGNLGPHDVEAILKLHRVYGLISVDEVGSRGERSFCGLVYSLDRPVSFAKIEAAIMRNREVLVTRGTETRKMAAVAVNKGLQDSINQSGRGDVLRELVLEVEERSHTRVAGDQRNASLDALDRDLADSVPFVDDRGHAQNGQGIRVTADAAPPAQRPRPRRRS
jgi:hypothetical protein